MAADPNMWGAEAWHTIHYVALNYPVNPTGEDRELYGNFFAMLGRVLPCVFCRQGFEENLKEYPIRLDSRKDLFDWTVDMHNAVNRKHGKPTLSYEEAYDAVIANGLKGNGGQPDGIPMKYVAGMVASFAAGAVVGRLSGK